MQSVIGGGTGGAHGPRHPHFYFWGSGPPLLNCDFCLNRCDTISIGPTLKVNRLMKKILQNFGSILSILFVIHNL